MVEIVNYILISRELIDICRILFLYQKYSPSYTM